MGRTDGANLEALGTFIRHRRHGLGLTQTQVASRLGWVQERISLLENGRYGMPSLPAMEQIAAALESSLGDVLAATGFSTLGTTTTSNGDKATQPTLALFYALEELLGIDAEGLPEALNQASDIVRDALGAEKVDAYMLDPGTGTLVAIGSSDTPLGHQQRDMGLDRLPIVNGGRIVDVFQTGTSYITGHADLDSGISKGAVEALGIRSILGVALSGRGDGRGVLVAETTLVGRFTDEDLHFLEAVARWVGIIAQRAATTEAVVREAEVEDRSSRSEQLPGELEQLLREITDSIERSRQYAARANQPQAMSDADSALRSLRRIRLILSDALTGAVDRVELSLS